MAGAGCCLLRAPSLNNADVGTKRSGGEGVCVCRGRGNT